MIVVGTPPYKKYLIFGNYQVIKEPGRNAVTRGGRSHAGLLYETLRSKARNPHTIAAVVGARMEHVGIT